MNEHHDLVPLPDKIHDLLVRGSVHSFVGCRRIRFTLDSKKVLLQWNRTEPAVKIEEALIRVDSEHEHIHPGDVSGLP
jgi:hypothetical protein